MKKLFIFLFMLSLLTGIEQSVMGQYCNSNGDPANVTITPNLLIAKPHYFYFGQVWYTEVSISKSVLQAAMPSGVILDNVANIKFSYRHSNFGGFNDANSYYPNGFYNAMKSELDATGGPWDTKKGDLRFWFARMSAGGGLLGKYLLVGVKVNGSYYWGKILWKVIPSNFTQNLTLSDRASIGNGVNKAHIVHLTQSTECRNCATSSAYVTPTVSKVHNSSLGVTAETSNHFIFNNFTNASESITLQYSSCSGATNGVQIGNPSVAGTSSTVSVQKQAAALSKVELDCQNTTIGPCNGSQRPVNLRLKGGSGVYEVNLNGEKVDISNPTPDPYNPVSDPQSVIPKLIDKYVLLRSDGLFGTSSINLAPGINTIKVRDTQIYDIVTGSSGGPTTTYGVNNGESIVPTLEAVKNLSQNGEINTGGYYTINIDVPACNVSTIQCTTSCTAYLSDLTPSSTTQGYGTLQKDKSTDGNSLRVGSNTYTKGLGTHANSNIKYNLGGNYKNFQAVVGRDIEANSCNCGTQKLRFKVKADGVQLFDSGDMTLNQTQNVNVDVTGKQQLELIVEDSGDSNYGDHADWADAKLSCNSTTPTCNFTLANNTQSGTTGTSLILNPNCTGTDCGNVSYSWTCSNGTSGNGLNVILPTTAANYTYTVTGTKSSCTSKTSTITTTVTSGGCLTVTSPGYNCGNKILEAITVSGGSGTYVYNIDGCENSIAKNIMGYTGDAAKFVDYPFWWQQLTLGNHTIYVRDKNNASCSGSVSLNVTCANTSTPTTLCAGARIRAAEENNSEEQEGIFIAPNPVNNILHYTFISDAETDEIQLQIFDMIGRSLANVKKQKTGRVTKGEISVESFMKGSYILNATDGIKKEAKRFIKE